MGHKEFVNNVQLIDKETLLSGSGDGKLILWKYLTGTRLFIYDLDVDDGSGDSSSSKSKFPVKSIAVDQNENAQNIIISFFNQKEIHIFQVVRNQQSVVQAVSRTEVFHLISQPCFIQFDPSHTNFVWIFGGFENSSVRVFEIISGKLQPSFNIPQVVDCLNDNQRLLAQVRSLSNDESEVNSYFKHHFNNVELYYQRKHIRQELGKKESINI